MKVWKKVKLGSLLTESKIVSENPNPNNRIRVKLNVLGVEKRPDTKDKKGATRYYIRKAGQFIYGKQNLHKGAFGIVPEELDGYESSSDIPAFDIDDSCYSEWIFYFFRKNNFYLKLGDLARGVGSKRIHPKQIFDLEIYLPSKEEQREILEAIQISKKKYKELLSEIKFQENNLIKLRKSILNDAIHGKLTSEWRTLNPNVESAKILIENINERKSQLIKENKIKREKKIIKIDANEIPFEVPKNWEWCRMQEVGILDRGKSKHRPRNDYKLFTSEHGYPFIQTGDVAKAKQTSGIIVTHNKNYSEYGLAQSKLWKKDTLCITIAANIAETGFLSYDACFPDSIVGFTNLSSISTSKFVQYFIDITKSDLERFAPSTAQKNINLGILYDLKFPLPPIEEQHEIVKKVTTHLKQCDLLERILIKNKIDSEKLFQVIVINLLGYENNVILKNQSIKEIKKNSSREIKYNSKTTNMDLIKLLKVNGKLHAEDLWKMSEHFDNKNINDSIDKFYSDLKIKIEIEKSIKEVTNEKGYIELV